MNEVNYLPCGHHVENFIEIEGERRCYVCWVIDSGNYTFPTAHGIPTGPEIAHHEVSALAGAVRRLAEQVAEQGRLLHRLLNQEAA